jgi:hypothetical protein
MKKERRKKEKAKSIEELMSKVKRVEKVSHLAWKIKGRASVCGTKFMYLQCEGEKV